ncbi:MAG: hypothetical protein ACRBBW_14605 [Cellvibrionaceae bacterium]
MKTFLKIIAQFALFIGAFWGLIAFLQWDESDRENAVVQILPFELNYTYEGEAESYLDANRWYARLYLESDNGQWTECHNHMIGLEDYENLKSISDQVPSSKRAYVIARVFETKSTGSTQCEVNVGNWEKFLSMAQPEDATAREFNALKRSEANKVSE